MEDWQEVLTKKNLNERKEMKPFLQEVGHLLAADGALVLVQRPMIVVGSIFGQLLDLLRIFRARGLPPISRYLFLGSYVDIGFHGVECLFVLYALKLLYPSSIFLLRGAHEDIAMNGRYGFRLECTIYTCRTSLVHCTLNIGNLLRSRNVTMTS